MSRIFTDEIVNLAGTGSVSLAQGASIPLGKTLDLSNASITLSAGKGVAGQALTSTGTGLNWTSLQDLNTTYSLSTADGATNKKTIKITGSDGITDSIVLAGGSNITLTRVNDEIVISSSSSSSSTFSGPVSSIDNYIPSFSGTDGNVLKQSTSYFDLSNNLIVGGSITTSGNTSSVIPFYYNSQSNFPSPLSINGAIAYDDNTKDLFYASDNQWIELAKLSDIIPDTNTTYSLSSSINNSEDEVTITLNGSDAVDDSFKLIAGDSISLSLENDDITISSYTYGISAQQSTGNSVIFRLSENQGNDTIVNDDITFNGADGIGVERTDENNITFKLTSSSVTQYTDGEAKDAAAQAILNGTHLGIAFTYDQQNQTINSQVGTVPKTYNLTVTASGFTDYQVAGTDRAGSVSGNDPAITVYEGDTINFDVSAVYTVHPLYIRDSDGSSSVSTPAATGEGTASVSWTPDTAGVYYYQCSLHPAMIGTITVLSAGGGGGGTSILYDLYGSNTTSNQLIINLDPSDGTTDTIEMVGGSGVTISWDGPSKVATFSSTETLQTITGRGATSSNSITLSSTLYLNSELHIGNSGFRIIPNSPSAGTHTIGGVSGVGGIVFRCGQSSSISFTNENGTNTFASISAANGLTAGGLTYPTTNGTYGDVLISDGNGNVSWATVSGVSAYNLPTADETTLGGIKIGSGLDIDEDGIVSVTASGVGGGVATRQEISGDTSTLIPEQVAELNIAGYKSYILLKVETSHEAWVRIYTDDASRDNDIGRSEGTDPAPGSGVIAEVRTSGAQTVLVTPGVIGFNNDVSPNGTIYLTVANKSQSTTPITVTLTAVKLED